MLTSTPIKTLCIIVVFFLCVPSFLSLLVSIIKQINIYINLIIKTIIIITIIILGIFSCPCVVRVVGWRVCWAGSRILLKLSQHGKCWQAGKCWERCWGLCFSENNGRTAMATFDNSYIKCYNKCNDDNKKAISHQSPKFALYGVFTH